MKYYRALRGTGVFTVAMAMYFVAAGSHQAGAQPLPKHSRPYSDGPLTADDFLGKRSASNRLAYTWARIRFDFRYQHKTRGKVIVAELVSANVFAVIDRNVSWNVAKSNAALLGHEQGHFDIAQGGALQVHLALLKQVKAGTPLTASGKSEQEAAAGIQAKILELIDLANNATAKAHREYDRRTRHGLVATPQAACRKEQQDRIIDLNAEIKQIPKVADPQSDPFPDS